MNPHNFPDFLRSKILENSPSIVKFCKESGVSRRAVYNLLENKVEETKLSTLIKLAETLNIHPMELMSVYFKDWDFKPVDTVTGRTSTLEKNDDIGFINDVTFPDNSMVTVHQKFLKIWRIQNTGKVIWKERKIICIDDFLKTTHQNGKVIRHGLFTEIESLNMPEVPPSEQYDIAIEFIAPSFPCTVVSHWKMVDRHGKFCFADNAPLSCVVKVMSL